MSDSARSVSVSELNQMWKKIVEEQFCVFCEICVSHLQRHLILYRNSVNPQQNLSKPFLSLASELFIKL